MGGPRSRAAVHAVGPEPCCSGRVLRPRELEHIQCPGWCGPVLCEKEGEEEVGLLLLGRGGRTTAVLLRCYSSCHAEGKLGFWDNGAALQIRTLRPVRGCLQEEGRFDFNGRQS